MPKFMTYQRPAPVNKAAWGGGRPGGNPQQPLRRQPATPTPSQPASPAVAGLPGSSGKAK